MGFSIDGGAEQVSSNYSPVNAGNSLLFTSSQLLLANHTLVIRVVGTHEPASSGIVATLDKAEVYNVSNATPTPTPIASPTPTPSATPTVSVVVSPTSVNEGSDATFTVSISHSNPTQTTVNYSMSGKASLGSDYTLTGPAGHAVIPAGQTSTTVVLHALTDNANERSETAVMTLNSGSGYGLPGNKSGKASTATVTILNVK